MAQMHTIEELEDALGLPIILLSARDATTKKEMVFRLRDLPLPAMLIVIAWINARLP